MTDPQNIELISQNKQMPFHLLELFLLVLTGANTFSINDGTFASVTLCRNFRIGFS